MTGKATDDVTMLKLNPIIPSRPKDRLSSELISESTTFEMSKLTLLISQIPQSDIFIGSAGKDLVLFSISIHACRLAVTVECRLFTRFRLGTNAL